ncbi:MAG: DPP IV N-terminal domain-containing protein [Acidobacteria bacterium]|nr:DPP IV N-terminal domain-containing protein [Acidobacteriota bacterium]
MTAEWIFGDEGRRVASLPSYVWLSDGKLMLYDSRQPPSQRTFEVLDPSTGTRRAALDMPAAITNLKTLLPELEIQQALPWPIAFDSTGRQALYLFKGDIFALDLAAARFSRLTKTDAEEKSPGFSPDGRHVAFVRANDLYVVDVATYAETRITRDGSETTLNGTLSWLYWEEVFGRRDIGYWWSPDSRALAYLQTDESTVPVSYFVDFQPVTPRLIKQRYAKAGMPNPQVRVGIAEIGRNATTWVRIADKPYDTILRVKWLPDSRRVSVQTMTRNQRELGLYFADRQTGATTRILTETDPGFVNIHDDLYFLADGKQFLWASERDDYYHLYRYTMDGRLVNQITRGSWAMVSSGGVFWLKQAVAGIDEANSTVYFTALEHSPIERHLYRINFDGSEMKRLSVEPGAHRISMAPNAQFYLDSFSDVRTLPALTLYRADGSRQSTIAAPRMELLAPFDIQYPELITIPAADGFPMPATILKPKNFRPDRKHPVILNLYGGTSSQSVVNAWQGNLFNQLLLAEGYIVVKVDNRAATGIRKSLENAVVGKLGDQETADFLDATRWLKAQPWVDAERVGVWGWSHGGWTTLNLLTRSTEFKAGISVAPVTDWLFYDTKWSEAFLQTPQENPEGYARTSLMKRAGDLHGRLLLVHGTYDDNVHPQNTQAFIDALIKAGKLFDMMYYPMRKHDIGDRDATIHLYRTMLDFWKRNL